MDFCISIQVGSISKILFSSRHDFPVYLKSEDRECWSCLTFPVLITGIFIFLPNSYTQYCLLLIFFSVSNLRFQSVWWCVSLIQIFDDSLSRHCFSLGGFFSLFTGPFWILLFWKKYIWLISAIMLIYFSGTHYYDKQQIGWMASRGKEVFASCERSQKRRRAEWGG